MYLLYVSLPVIVSIYVSMLKLVQYRGHRMNNEVYEIIDNLVDNFDSK